MVDGATVVELGRQEQDPHGGRLQMLGRPHAGETRTVAVPDDFQFICAVRQILEAASPTGIHALVP